MDIVERTVDMRLTICNVLSCTGLHFLMLELKDNMTQIYIFGFQCSEMVGGCPFLFSAVFTAYNRQ